MMCAKSWHAWVISTIVPLIFVLYHFATLAGDDRLTVSSVANGARPPAGSRSRVPASPSAAGTAGVAGGSTAPLRSFLDVAWSEWGSEESQFRTLVPPSEIDYAIKNRLPWEQRDYSARGGLAGRISRPEGKCSGLLLFMPQLFARNGHGSQLNSYLLAAMVATFAGKAMVLLEAPQKYSKYPNGSQFGCPIDAFANPEEFLNFKGNNHGKLEMRRDFPRGLKRLIEHPEWLSRDCPVPICNTFDYNSWDKVRKGQREHFENGLPPREIKCEEEVEGRGTEKVMVTVLGGEEVRQYFERQYKKRMLDRSSRRARENAYNWAVRLGATRYQADVFSKIRKESDIWDYVSALIARSGLVTFQPWIARDVKEFIQMSALPLESPHDAIHVRRGDKLATEAREEVVNYWHSQGFERQVDFPLNYIPFQHYLRLWERECVEVWSGLKKKRKEVRTIYLATDDPDTVKKEIKKLPRGKGGTTIVGGCERVKFVFSPDAHHGSFHLSEGGVRSDCVERYKRNIHAIADLMILTKSNTFVGEFNSNWGRVVRVFRTQLNDAYIAPDSSFGWRDLFGLWKEEEPEAQEPPVLVHDIRLAFAEDKPVPPPGW